MIRRLEDLPKLRREENDAKLGVVFGGFDILHRGHVDFLRFAADQVEKLVVGAWSDELIRRSKGEPRPVHGIDDRLAVLDELKPVSYVLEVPSHYLERMAGAMAVVNVLEPDAYIRARSVPLEQDFVSTISGKEVPIICDFSYAQKNTSTTRIVDIMESLDNETTA